MNQAHSFPVSSARMRQGLLRARLGARLAWNPIMKREVGARWRRLPAFAVVLGYASVLALAVGWRYGDLAGRYDITQSAVLGRQIFAFLTRVQTVGWLLLAPVLTATSIGGEREKGTMIGLQLSGLTPREIARGKWQSAFAFIALLLLAPMPVTAICFLLGGVTPIEFGAALALHASTAAVGAAIGLCCSAYCRKLPATLACALTATLVWNFVPPLALIGPWFGSILLERGDPEIAVWVFIACALLTPIALKMLLEITAWSLLRPQQPSAPVERVDQWTPSAPIATPQEREAAPHKLGEWKRLPLVARLQFDNPVLTRELRSRLQVREGALGAKGSNPTGALMFCGLIFTMMALFELGIPEVAHANWILFSNIWLFAILLAAPVLGAAAFTREREAGMLTQLFLTRLSRADLLKGKAGGVLLVCAYYSLALAPVLLPALLPNLLGVEVTTPYEGYRQARGVSLSQGFSTLLIVAASAWIGTCGGVAFSWLFRQTWLSTVATLAAFFGVFVALPMLIDPRGSTLRDSDLSGVVLWHPFYALKNVMGSNPGAGVNAMSFFLLWTVIGCGLLGLVYWRMKRGALGQDQILGQS